MRRKRRRCILRLPQVIDRTGHSRSQIYRLQACGKMPHSIKTSARSVGWADDEIDEYVEELIAESRGAAS